MSEPEKAPTQAIDEEHGASRDFFSRGRLLLMAGVLALELVIFLTSMVAPMNHATQQSIQQQANSLRNATYDASPAALVTIIFSNNVRIALVEMIPAVGALVFVKSIFTTGQVIQVLASSSGLPSVLLGITLFVFPFSIIELSAYAVAVGSGSMLLVGWRRKRLQREFRVFLLEVVAVVVLLLIAAAMETATILSPMIGFALWVPIGLLVVWSTIALRKNMARAGSDTRPPTDTGPPAVERPA